MPFHFDVMYTDEEDLQLCHIYFVVSQRPINGIKHKNDALWEKIVASYNVGKVTEMIMTKNVAPNSIFQFMLTSQ